MEEISLFYDYYNTPIYTNQYEKTFQNGGYIKIPFQNNKSLSEPNLIVTNGNMNIKYKTENIYIFNNIHKIPEFSKSSKFKILPENENDDTPYKKLADGELVIEHTPLTNGSKKVYTVFLLKTIQKNDFENTPIDSIINFSTLHFEESLNLGSGDASAKNVNLSSTSFSQNSFSPTLRSDENVNLPSQSTANWSSSTLCTEESPNILKSFSLNNILNSNTIPNCITNKEQTVFIFKTPLLYTSFNFNLPSHADTDGSLSTLRSGENVKSEEFLKSTEFLFPVFKKSDYSFYKVYIQSPDKVTSNIYKKYSNSSTLRSEEFINSDSYKELQNEGQNKIEKEPVTIFSEGKSSIGVEALTVAVDDDDSNNLKTGTPHYFTSDNINSLKLTDNLKLQCNQTSSSTGELKFEPINFILVIFSCIGIFAFLSGIVYIYDKYVNDEINNENNCFNYLITIYILLVIIFFPLLSSWMKEIKYIGLFSSLLVILTFFINLFKFYFIHNNFEINFESFYKLIEFNNLNFKEENLTSQATANLPLNITAKLDTNNYLYIFCNSLKPIAYIFYMIFAFIFGIFALLPNNQKYKDKENQVDQPYIYFNTVRYVNYRYPDIYWFRIPPCEYDGQPRDYTSENKKIPNGYPSVPYSVPCSDFKQMVMSSTNTEIFGLFLLPLLTRYLFSYLFSDIFKSIIVNFIEIIILLIAIIVGLAYVIPNSDHKNKSGNIELNST